jgi:hypothetical protein
VDHLVNSFPAATEVVVVGESAGSIAAPVYAGILSDHLPDARITVLANGSGSYPDAPEISALFDRWDTPAVLPDWVTDGGAAVTTPQLTIQSGQHDPDIVFARIDYAYDAQQARFYPLFNLPVEDILEGSDGNERNIESQGVEVWSYVPAGDGHSVVGSDIFYSLEVDSVLLLEWAANLIRGEPVADVHCTSCDT